MLTAGGRVNSQIRRVSRLVFVARNLDLIIKALEESKVRQSFRQGTVIRKVCDRAREEVPYSKTDANLDIFNSITSMLYDITDKTIYWSEKEQKFKTSNKKRKTLFKASMIRKFTPEELRTVSRIYKQCNTERGRDEETEEI